VDQETGRLYFEPEAESPKFEALTGIIEDMGQAPALILTHSQQYARLITERLNSRGISAFEWSGKITQKRRDDALEDFISGKIRYIVAVISAIGTGSDGLQEATNVEIWLSESDDGTDNQQARGRLDRRGQEKQVVRIKIQAEGTYDEGIVSKQIQDALKMNESLRKKVNA
jgi:SNF2 family DNA or RNA helicase